jgi:hypothetical protein
MKTLALTTFGCIFYFFSIAQNPTEILQGYYVNLSGDTVRGNFPGYRQREFSPEKIDFVSVPGVKLELIPSNTKLVSIAALDLWVPYTGQRVSSPMDLNMLSDYNSAAIEKFDTVTAFLRFIGEAKGYSFYILNDRLRRNIFYSNDGSTMVELRNHMYKVGSSLGESRVYIQQLMNLLNPDARLMESINRLEYTEESFKRMFKQTGYATGSNTRKPFFTVIAGLSVSTMNDVSNYATVNSEFNSSVSPLIGVNFTLPVDRNFNKYFFYLQVKSYQYNHSRKESFPGQPTPSTRTFKGMVVSPGVHFGYNFINKPALRGFISPGLTFNMDVGTKHSISWNNITNEDNQSYSKVVPEIQAGVSMFRLLVWGGYSFPSKTPLFYGYSGKRSSFQLGAGIRL